MKATAKHGPSQVQRFPNDERVWTAASARGRAICRRSAQTPRALHSPDRMRQTWISLISLIP